MARYILSPGWLTSATVGPGGSRAATLTRTAVWTLAAHLGCRPPTACCGLRWPTAATAQRPGKRGAAAPSAGTLRAHLAGRRLHQNVALLSRDGRGRVQILLPAHGRKGARRSKKAQRSRGQHGDHMLIGLANEKAAQGCCAGERLTTPILEGGAMSCSRARFKIQTTWSLTSPGILKSINHDGVSLDDVGARGHRLARVYSVGPDRTDQNRGWVLVDL